MSDDHDITTGARWTTKPDTRHRTPKTVRVVLKNVMQDPPFGTAKVGEPIVVLRTVTGIGAPTFWETEADFRSMYEPERT